jgi:radical SAM superfamily enzyme YgiQ (UPF0313 family)
MRISLLRPHLSDMRSSDALEPLAFAILAGLTPPEVELSFFDERLEDLPEDDTPDLAALSVETYTARRAYQIARGYRRRGVPVVLGGYHPSFLPDEALAWADSVVVGDAEEVWPRVVADARVGRLERLYRAPRQPPLAGLRFDRRIFAGKRYGRVAPVQYGRGCRFACDFCSIRTFYGSKTRQRPVAEVAAEIEALERRWILLVDDNLFVDRGRAEELFCALKPLGVRWGCQVSIDVAADEELLDRMAESGCVAALIGFESLSEGNLGQMRKRWNTRHGGYAAAVARLGERGILIYGSFVFGYDHDTVESFDRTAEFAIRSKLSLVNFSPLTPTPGSPVFERLKAEGRLLHERWWLDPGYRYGDATFRPRRMTAEQLEEGCLAARRAFYGAGSIFRRALDRRTHAAGVGRLGLYLALNLVARRELSRKLGRPLGSAEPLVEGEASAAAPAQAGTRLGRAACG